MTRNSTYTECMVAFVLQQWLPESATMLRNTSTAYLVHILDMQVVHKPSTPQINKHTESTLVASKQVHMLLC